MMNYLTSKQMKNSIFGAAAMQERTSANTSINSTRIPTAFKRVKPLGHVCDYGCGKYTEHIRTFCMGNGATGYSPYDLYNQPFSTNVTTAFEGEKKGFDTIYCCNVVNVIDSDETCAAVMCHMYSWLKPNGRLVIQIYEGDKSGKGRETKKDCYQRNEVTSSYVWLLEVIKSNNHPFTWCYLGSNIILITKGV